MRSAEDTMRHGDASSEKAGILDVVDKEGGGVEHTHDIGDYRERGGRDM